MQRNFNQQYSSDSTADSNGKKKSNGEKSFFPLLNDMGRDRDLKQEQLEIKYDTYPPLWAFPFCNTHSCYCPWVLLRSVLQEPHSKLWFHWPSISYAKQSPLPVATNGANEHTELLADYALQKAAHTWWDVDACMGSLVSSNSFGDSTSLSSLRPINMILLLEEDYIVTDFLKSHASLHRRHCQESSVIQILTHRSSHTRD